MWIDASPRRALRGYIVGTAIVLLVVTAGLYFLGMVDGESTADSADTVARLAPIEPPRSDGLETAVFALG